MPVEPIAAVEAGGTKFVLAVGTGPSDVRDRTTFPTGDDPAATIARAVDWVRERGPFAAIGIASFGPVDLDLASPTFGFITTTPKLPWQHTDLVGPFRRAFGVPVGFDTDTNGAALGEHRWGAAVGLDDFLYVTMGTGIGVGGMVGGKLIHGRLHPEAGHLLLPMQPGDTFAGACPFHGRCWEGLCSGPAMRMRTGTPAESLTADDPAWELSTTYTGQALLNLALVTSPRRIIVGGSVSKGGRLGQAAWFDQVRSAMTSALRGYISPPDVVPPGLGDNAGVLGAMALGINILASRTASAVQ